MADLVSQEFLRGTCWFHFSYSKTIVMLCRILFTSLFSVLILHSIAQYNEKYRPQYHFTPNSGWIGDPDGLVKFKNTYHLFWWGHAISTDLVHWNQMPYPIQGDPTAGFSVNTGSAVIDVNNIANFGKNKMLGFHTIDRGSPRAQGVGYSVSTDTTTYGTLQLQSSGNSPLIGNYNDFRDPQVFQYSSNRWIMLVALGAQRKIAFYTSSDLKSWTHIYDFGPAGGASGDNWETPDLVQLPVDGSSTNKKWVLIYGVYPGSGNVVSQQYCIGTFDGTTFTLTDGPYPVDKGRDFYAARTWRDYDNSNIGTIILGWMGNWSYSPIAPSQNTYKGKGVMSLPRQLSLTTYPEGVRLTQTPIGGLQNLRNTTSGVSASNQTITGTNNITNYCAFTPSKNVYEFDATFTVNPSATFGFNFCVNNSLNKRLVVKYRGTDSTLTIDRSNCSDVYLNDSFLVPVSTVVAPDANNKIRLHGYVDQSSIEVFANDGKNVMSMLTYPGTNQLGIEVFSTNGSTTLTNFTGWELNSIWNPNQGYKIISGATYMIKARHDGKMLDSPSQSPGNGTQMQQWDSVGGANQQWKVDSIDVNNYRLTNIGANKVLDLDGASTADGAKIQQWTDLGNANQKWQLVDIGGGYYRIKSNDGSGPSVDGGSGAEVEGGSTVNGHQVQQWRFLGYQHQEWSFLLINNGNKTALPNKHSLATRSTNDSTRFIVYPNPVVTGSVTVAANPTNFTTSGEENISKIELISSEGIVLKRIKNNKSVSNCNIKTSTLSKGIYYLNIFSDKKEEKHKLDIQ